ncbi:MAG: methyltransferase domain-containing protein [Terrimicrobiaceae bacterium]
MSDLTRQTIANLQGEIAFRRKLARQHTTGEVLLPDYLGKDQHDVVLAERIETTTTTFRDLAQRGVDFSTFLELGAERGHRALALANHLHAVGVATDLSFDQLRTAEFFARQFGLPRVPMRICCDANHLPFRSGSVPFAFCYQFLHHFPGLETIVPEIHRILAAGGSFFFDEEPMGRLLQLHFYTQKKKDYPKSRLGKLWQWFEGLISDAACDEVDHGVIENHSMPMAHWQKNLRVFADARAHVRTLRYIRSQVGRTPTPMNLPALLLGGVISGFCTKSPAPNTAPARGPETWLICPKHLIDSGCEAPLVREGDHYRCTESDEKYPIVDDIPILIEPTLRRQLYPEFG